MVYGTTSYSATILSSLPLPPNHPPHQHQPPPPPPPPGSGSGPAFFPAAAASPFRFAAHPQVRRPSLLPSSHRVPFRTERIPGAIAICRSLSRYPSSPSCTDAVVALRMAINPRFLPIAFLYGPIRSNRIFFRAARGH